MLRSVLCQLVTPVNYRLTNINRGGLSQGRKRPWETVQRVYKPLPVPGGD